MTTWPKYKDIGECDDLYHSQIHYMTTIMKYNLIFFKGILWLYNDKMSPPFNKSGLDDISPYYSLIFYIMRSNTGHFESK